GRERRREQRARRAAQIAATRAQDEQEAGVGDSRQHTEERTELRVRTVCPVLEHPGDEEDSEADDRNRSQRRALRALSEECPREQTHEHDLRVAEHRRESGADLLDRVVPEDEVGGEESPCQPRKEHGPAWALAVAAVLEPREEPERRQRPDPAV